MQAELDRAKRQFQHCRNLALAQILEIAKNDDFAQLFGKLRSRLADNSRFHLIIEDFCRIVGGCDDIFYGTNCEVLLDKKQV